LNPNAGLTLSIPIFQKGQVKNNIKTAKIATESAKLDEVDAKNTLRKEIEQAVVDNNTAKANYYASEEQYEASKEAYAVAEEKYGVGVINTVDFMLVKSDLIEAESSLLQQKYNLLFSDKIIDFYKGIPIRFSN
jgi:outer membrane protein